MIVASLTKIAMYFFSHHQIVDGNLKSGLEKKGRKTGQYQWMASQLGYYVKATIIQLHVQSVAITVLPKSDENQANFYHLWPQ